MTDCFFQHILTSPVGGTWFLPSYNTKMQSMLL